jgi:cobalt-zinc-cadmium resistance protein CzcA
MIDAILKLSLRFRIFVVLAMLAFAAFSLWMLPSLTIDAFPDTTPVQVQINTYATGLAAEEVERQVTFPIEQEINGMPKLSQLRSLSKFGLSQVTVTFEDGTNIYFARQQVTERINNAVLPAGVVKPTLGPVATGLGEVLHFMVQPSSPETSLTDVRTFFDWVVKPSLRKVPGVAEINAWGGEKKQYQIRIDPDRLKTYDISFEQVVDAIKATNMNAGGSNINRGTETLIIQGIARTTTLDQIRNIVVGIKKDIPIQVSDVAVVMVGNDTRLGAISYMGKGESVMGLGFMLIGESSNTVTHRLKEKYEKIKESLPKDIKMDIAYDRTELVDKVIGTVRGNLFEGGLLVIAILFVFLGNLRAGIVVATAIPFSMFFAFNGMMAFGIAGSLLSLGAIDFGMVVDSSVVLVEHLMSRMGEEGAEKRNRLELIYEAAMEVRMPTLFGELIIIIVYLPILTLEGVEGKLFRPMALTVVFALIGSLILSLTLIPALAAILLPKKMSHSEPLLVRIAVWIYKPVLKLVLKFRIAAIMMVVCVSLVAIMMARSLGSEFIPKLSEGAIVINIFRPVGTSIQEAVRYNTKLEKMVLAAFPDEVKKVWSRLGSPEVATDPMGPEETDFFITLNPREKWTKAKTQEELIGLIDGLIKPLIGQEYSFTQPIEQRVNEMISGVRADVAVKIFGDDFEVLKKKAEQVEQILKNIQGAEDVIVEPVSGQPVLQIKLKQEQLATHGLAAKTVLQHIETLGSQPLGEILDGEQRFPLVAKFPDNLRARPEAVGALIITTTSGEKIPLSGVADIQEIRGPSRISREWGQRRITIQCNVRNRDVGSFVTEAQKQIKAKVSFPSSRYRVEWGGQFEQLAAAKSRLAIIVPISLLMIIFLLYLTYRNMTDTLIVFSSVPLACIGGVAALWFRQMPFSISAAVGFIALFGLGVLNGMLLVTFIRQLRAEGMALLQAIENAGVTRLRAVLMTALVAGFGFIPMAFSDGVGAEVQRPLASVVIGGVISSSALTLFILPVIYSFFAPAKVPALETK